MLGTLEVLVLGLVVGRSWLLGLLGSRAVSVLGLLGAKVSWSLGALG
jgi:hypothetical protein